MKSSKVLTMSICWLVILTLSGLSAVAGPPLKRDSTVVEARNFDQQLISRYKADPDFRYETVVEPTSSLWDRFWYWVWTKIAEIFRSETGRWTFYVGLRLAIAAILVFFIWQILKMRSAGMFTASKTGQYAFSVDDEDIHSIDFDAEIAKATEEGNYRLAVRLLYLRTLKLLSDGGLITWRLDKTNVSYVNELREARFYLDFRSLTSQFEKNWYGNIPIGKEEFEEVKAAFESLNSQLRR